MTHTPRKRFGQNFIKDSFLIQSIMQSIPPATHIVEIGPGLGALTHHLIAQAQTFSAVEIDRDLVQRLLNQFPKEQYPHIQIHSADALKFNFSTLEPKPFRLVGNLPYNISTPLLIRLFGHIDHILDMNIMLQKEVVDRLAAAPGTKTYGRLSVIAQYFCDILPVLDIPPEAFYPEPKVDSTFVKLIPKKNREKINLEHFETIVREAFHCRRKTLANNLKTYASKEKLIQMGFDPNLRAEVLSVSEFIALSQGLSCPIAL
jgi:16S rRNA (adenine1518-N6/adenine1519-N6)-dimethyltransferase